MTTGRSVSGPMPPLHELAQRAGVTLPALENSQPGINLGDIRPIVDDPSRSKIAKQTLERIDAVRLALVQAAQVGANSWDVVPFSFPEYLEAVHSINRLKSAFMKGNDLPYPFNTYTGVRFTQEIYRRDLHTNDFEGYIKYVCAVHPSCRDCLRYVALPALDEGARVEHTYITGGSNSGKTELLKALVHHDIQKSDRAVVIIGP